MKFSSGTYTKICLFKMILVFTWSVYSTISYMTLKLDVDCMKNSSLHKTKYTLFTICNSFP